MTSRRVTIRSGWP